MHCIASRKRITSVVCSTDERLMWVSSGCNSILEKLTHQLVEWGLVINPYDLCVANKVINGSQFMITWHVNNLKMSHVDPRVLDAFLDDLNHVFSKESPLVVHKGPCHDYLGNTLDYSTPRKVIVDMKQYVDKLLSEAPPDIKGVAQAPSGEHLFKVNPECKRFNRILSKFKNPSCLVLM